jgi:DNA-binding winged helix-turn-helix (wHTH) protein
MVANRQYEFGPFCLDPAERRLLRDGKPVGLTPKCFDLLVTLVENSGHLMSKEELLNRLWPDQFVEEANLSFNISSLRKVLGEGQNDRRFLRRCRRRAFAS